MGFAPRKAPFLGDWPPLAATPRTRHTGRAIASDAYGQSGASALAQPLPDLRSDAYLRWADETRFRDAGGELGAGRWLWLLLDLRQTASAFYGAAWPHRDHWIRVPGLYGAPPVGLEEASYCTALVSPEFLAVLRGGPGSDVPVDVLPCLIDLREAIQRYEFGYSMEPWRYGAGYLQPTKSRMTQALRSVVIGVVDDGLAFANRRFCQVDGKGRLQTRFMSFWDQDGLADGYVPGLYGRVLPASELQHFFDLARTAGGDVDEPAVYSAAHYRAVRRRITHGTHVTDLACGAEPEVADARVGIVGVQLPGDLLEDGSCASSATFLLDALWYVLDQADRTTVDGAAVINVSIGNIAGPHDGHSIFDAALDQLIALRRGGGRLCHVVMPVGNSYLLRCHAWGELAPRAEMAFDWQVQPDDKTPSFAELWFDDTAAQGVPIDISGIQLTVTPPGGHPSIRIEVGKYEMLSINHQTAGVFSLHQQESVANGNLGMGLLAIAPTVAVDPEGAVAPAGTWKIQIYNVGQLTINCNAYVQRDDVAFGRTSLGRQSFFDDPDYRVFDSHGAPEHKDSNVSFVRRVGTLNALATAREVDLAEGSQCGRGNSLSPADYASEALPLPTRGARPLPLSAVTEDSDVLRGVLAAGTFSGSFVALSGTSMAAPQLTRALTDAYLASGVAMPNLGRSVGDLDPYLWLPPAFDLEERSRRRRGLP